MKTLDENTNAVLKHIMAAVNAHQIPDLTLVKSLRLARQREQNEMLSKLELKKQHCKSRAEQAASAMYQRHHYAADNASLHDVTSPYHPFTQHTGE
ncbi:MAG: hypothetical protein ACFHVJ_10905 [Aestuariibacter sp.]